MSAGQMGGSDVDIDLRRLAISVREKWKTILGVALVAIQDREVAQFHAFYGFLTLVAVGLAPITAAAVGALVYVSDDSQLRNLTFWTMGSLGGAGWMLVGIALAVTLPSALLLLRFERALDLFIAGLSTLRLRAGGLGTVRAELCPCVRREMLHVDAGLAFMQSRVRSAATRSRYMYDHDGLPWTMTTGGPEPSST